MANKRFVLVANINTEDPAKIEKALIELVGVNAILRTEDGFKVKTTMEGVSAREMNRAALFVLRRVQEQRPRAPGTLTVGLRSVSRTIC